MQKLFSFPFIIFIFLDIIEPKSKMNLDAERIQLIDISLEDDFLIDEHMDITPFDLRLSVSFETQNELPLDPKSRARPAMKDRAPFLAKDERDSYQLDKKNGDKECNPRKSLAWDQSFFTSPGFLELEELCLVNRGFRNLEVSSSHGIEDNVKGKVCHGRKLGHKPRIGAGSKQKTSIKTKVASPNKMVSMPSSNQQLKNTERSEAFSGMVAKSHLVQNTSSKKDSQKSNRTIMGQTSISILPARKPPLRAVSKRGLATNSSPYKTTTGTKQTACVLKSQEKQGECRVDSYSAASVGSQKSGIKRSPLSSKTSSLRVPSQKLGFFDMNPETFGRDQDSTKHANAEQRRKKQPIIKKKSRSLESEEKENILHPDDSIIELEIKKDSPSCSQLVGNGFPASSGQCSSSSKKSLTKTQQPKRRTMLSPISAPRTPFLAKFSPLKKSALF